MTAALDRFIDGMAVHFGVDPEVTRTPGWTAAPMPDRDESRVATAYRLRDHVIVPCPSTRAADVVPPGVTTVESWVEALTGDEVGAEMLGGALMQTLSTSGLRGVPLPEGYTLARVTPDDAEAVAAIAALVERSDDEDVEYADIEIDELDPRIVLAYSGDGRAVAYASARPWDEVDDFGDIGVLTDADHRGRRLGAAVVSELCEWLLAEGIDPLYRRNDDREASARLSIGLGFVPAAQIVAVQFPEA